MFRFFSMCFTYFYMANGVPSHTFCWPSTITSSPSLNPATTVTPLAVNLPHVTTRLEAFLSAPFTHTK